MSNYHALIEGIAEALHIEKAYNLPSVCVSLGLETGTEGEAFSSKRVYVRKRLVAKSLDELTAIGNEVLTRYPSEHLEQVLLSFDNGLGVDGSVINLVFASTGPKPDIILADSVSNRIEIVENAETCLIYDLPIGSSGLSWSKLVGWYAKQNKLLIGDSKTEFRLYHRLKESLASPPEILLFETYFKSFRREFDANFPALIPQIYLHYDPKTVVQQNGKRRLKRMRMDFLMLFSNSERIVIEVDGKQHYSEDEIASPKLYSEMVSEDRKLKLYGYEVYRFGGYELYGQKGKQRAETFFCQLLARHGVVPSQ